MHNPCLVVHLYINFVHLGEAEEEMETALHGADLGGGVHFIHSQLTLSLEVG